MKIDDLSEKQMALIEAARKGSEKALFDLKVGVAIQVAEETVTGGYSLSACGTASACAKRAVLYKLNELRPDQRAAVTAMATYVQTGSRKMSLNSSLPCNACEQDYMKVREVSGTDYLSASSMNREVAIAKMYELFPDA
ncbi:Uncharacterised protein [uncultured archaeon]|nr:Uncharacterised protein [uncultured archaeon]